MTADRTTYAIGMALLGVFCVSASDVATKWISSDISLWQLLFMRSFIGIVILIPILLITRQWSSIQVKNKKTLSTRTGLMLVTYLLFFSSLSFLPIAVVAGGFFSSPSFMIVLSYLMLQEKAGMWRIGAVIAGFIGVLLILRPDSAAFEWTMLVPVLGGLFYALTQVYTRKHCKNETAIAIAYWMTIAFILLGLVGILMIWVWPPVEANFLTHPLTGFNFTVGWVILGIGLCSLTMHFALASAYQNAPASLIGPMEYMYLPLAVIGGVIFLDETPTDSSLVGITIIIAAGLVIAWRERVMSLKAMPSV